MKGIVLAGGLGTRLFPLTKVVSKQLLPVYNKPLIYYPLSTLMLAGIREILIITTEADLNHVKKLLGNGDEFGISISYKVQNEPRGLPEAFIIGEDFLDGDDVCLILGDNIFHGQGLGRDLENIRLQKGAHIFAYPVQDPQRFGVIEFNEFSEIVGLEEKPIDPKSNLAITGIYFFDSSVVELAKTLQPSARGELEIVELIRIYLSRNMLSATILQRGTAWLDAGTFESLLEASTFVKIIESRTGLNVGNPRDVALIRKWI